MDTSYRLSSGVQKTHLHQICILLLALAGPGCGNPIAGPDKGISSDMGVNSKMSSSQVDSHLGTGEDIPYAELPKDSAGVVIFGNTKGQEGVTYRRGVQGLGKNTRTLFAAFKDGKMIAEPLVLMEGH